jgi:zinc transport system permease protein
MNELMNIFTSPDTAFMRYALLAGLLASIPFGILGSYIVTRRISYIAGAISHSVLGGIGIALYLQKACGIDGVRPIYGALAASLISALIIGLVSIYAKEREDTVIGAIWAVGMATGLLFLSKTPGYVNAMSYLFGDILMISEYDIYVILCLNAVIILTSLLFYKKLLAVCFDEEFARLRGINVNFYYLLLLCLCALAIVLLVRIVGIVLVIALLTLPAAISGQLTKRLGTMMLMSVLFCIFFMTAGITLSYPFDFPAGPTVILLAGTVFLLLTIIAFLMRRGKS